MSYVGRLAPSPTGALHLGNARTFMIAWLRARARGGKVILRMEDLDHPRDKPGAAREAIEDLKWLGFDWDEEYVQSERKSFYRDALERLTRRRGDGEGFLYPCVCSRKDVENAQSAPHAGEQLFYPGTCRGRFASWQDAQEFLAQGSAFPCRHMRQPCWRFRVPDETVVEFDDVFAGHFRQDVSRILGDFPVARDEFGAGYTLAVTVDDALMGVTEVVRGDDLLAATPAQILIYRALGYEVPVFCHVPLVVGPDGKRLAKRHGDTRVASYRAAGRRPEELLGLLAKTCGWGDGSPISLRDLLSCHSLSTIPKNPVVL